MRLDNRASIGQLGNVGIKMSGLLSRRKSSSNAREFLAAGAQVKIALLGKKGVGKSAITVRLLTRRYIGEYDPNLETTSRYVTRINGEETMTEIMDTAQRNDEDKILSCAQWADCLVLVYSLTDKESFEEISRIKRIIDKKGQCSLKPIVIIANKSDLRAARDVSHDTGAQFASEAGCPHHEISARESYVEVEKVFHSIIDMTVRCSIIKDQINKLCVPNTATQREARERRPSLKSLVRNLTRQKAVKEESVYEERVGTPKTDKKEIVEYRRRERSSTCTF